MIAIPALHSVNKVKAKVLIFCKYSFDEGDEKNIFVIPNFNWSLCAAEKDKNRFLETSAKKYLNVLKFGIKWIYQPWILWGDLKVISQYLSMQNLHVHLKNRKKNRVSKSQVQLPQ